MKRTKHVTSRDGTKHKFRVLPSCSIPSGLQGGKLAGLEILDEPRKARAALCREKAESLRLPIHILVLKRQVAGSALEKCAAKTINPKGIEHH